MKNTGPQSLGYDFEELCKKILISNGFSVENNTPNDHSEIDLIFNKGVLRIYVEVKLYRSKIVLPKAIDRAVDYICKEIQEDGIKLVIVSADLSNPLKDQILKTRNVHLWDIKDLFHLAFNQPEEYYGLAILFTKATTESADSYLLGENSNKEAIIYNLVNEKGDKPKPSLNVEKEGDKLCDKLKSIDFGRREIEDEDGDDSEKRKKVTADKLYEKTCQEILEYLFKDHLSLWEKQHYTDAAIHKFDLICRIGSVDNFWIELSKDFNSRYVLFEFKNYKKKITQGQIYTTEKYLFNRGLRTIAFIISRKGADKNALIAAKGALRENGKLIVNLTDEDLCKMLTIAEGKHVVDKKEDPTEVLIAKIDELLTKTIR